MTVPPGGPSPWSPDQLSPDFGKLPGSPGVRRWIWVGVSLAAVVAVVVGLLVWQNTPGGDSEGSGQAADDGVDRTVGLMREKDPVCDDWQRFADDLAENERAWAAVDDEIPATKWTPQQHKVFDSVGEDMLTAAGQFESLLPAARSIVIRELIAQTVVYLRAFVERIPTYTASDRLVAGAGGNFSNAVTYMCSAVPLVPIEGAEVWQSEVLNPAELRPIIDTRDPICTEFMALTDSQDEAISGWAATDSTIPASEFTAGQRELFDAVRFVLLDDLEDFRDLASRSEGRAVGDLVATHNAYMQAFADAIPNYSPDDVQLWNVVVALGGGIVAACEAPL